LHIIGLAFRYKLCEISAAAQKIPLGEKRKKGRPKKTTPALIYQPGKANDESEGQQEKDQESGDTNEEDEEDIYYMGYFEDENKENIATQEGFCDFDFDVRIFVMETFENNHLCITSDTQTKRVRWSIPEDQKKVKKTEN